MLTFEYTANLCYLIARDQIGNLQDGMRYNNYFQKYSIVQHISFTAHNSTIRAIDRYIKTK